MATPLHLNDSGEAARAPEGGESCPRFCLRWQQNPLLVPVPQGMRDDASLLSELTDREVNAVSLNLRVTRRSRLGKG